MAIYDISEVNNAVQITKDGNYDQVQKGYYQIDDPSTDNILYIQREGKTQYKIDTTNDTITVNSVAFVGNSNALKDQINSFFFKASEGGIPTPPLTGEQELISIDGVRQWDTRPYTVDTGTEDARFKEDVFVSGELYTQQGSVNIGTVSHKSSNDRAFEVNNGDVYLKPRIKLTGISEISEGNKEVITFNKFTKLDTQGQLQPVQDRVMTSVLDANTNYHVIPLLATGVGNVWVNNWYLRSSTGFDNYIIQAYKGHINLSTITYELDYDGFPKITGLQPFFLSDLRSNFLNGNGFSAAASTTSDIQVPLNSSTGYWQNDGEDLTFVAFSPNAFEYEAGQLSGFDYPYVLADGVNWDEINTSADVIINGNLTLNGYNNYQLSNNATEYFGCQTLLKQGVYNKIEIPYKNRTSTNAPAYLYAIILDQDDNTIAYKRLYVGVNANTEGTFILSFDEDVIINQAGVYQIVIGRRKWSQGNRQADIFTKDINSSDGSIWLARGDQSNPSLNSDDTSAVDWSTIQKQNYNKIPKALIYKEF